MQYLKTGLTIIAPLLLIACGANENTSHVNDALQTTHDKQIQTSPPTSKAISAGALSGQTITIGPNSPHILIVPGSGPTDLNGNNPQGVNANSYRYLAEQLAARGISTTRIDKRGMFSSASAGDPNDVTIKTYAQDYRTWIDSLTSQTGQSCIYLLGHSEGALMVSAAAIGRKDVCGLILVSGSGRKFGNLLREQLKANPANAPILDQALGAITQIEAGNRVDTSAMHPALKGLFAAPVQNFLISLMSADPADIAAQAKQKTLILQGNHDIQTAVIDAENLRDATQGKLVILEGVNHILKLTPKDRASNLASYQNPDLPVAESVINAITDFISQH